VDYVKFGMQLDGPICCTVNKQSRRIFEILTKLVNLTQARTRRRRLRNQGLQLEFVRYSSP